MGMRHACVAGANVVSIRAIISQIPKILFYSLCSTTINPMIPNMTVLSHGCSESMIVTQPTKGIYPKTEPGHATVRFLCDSGFDKMTGHAKFHNTYYILPDQIVLSPGVEFGVIRQVIVSLCQQFGLGPERNNVSPLHPDPQGVNAWRTDPVPNFRTMRWTIGMSLSFTS